MAYAGKMMVTKRQMASILIFVIIFFIIIQSNAVGALHINNETTLIDIDFTDKELLSLFILQNIMLRYLSHNYLHDNSNIYCGSLKELYLSYYSQYRHYYANHEYFFIISLDYNISLDICNDKKAKFTIINKHNDVETRNKISLIVKNKLINENYSLIIIYYYNKIKHVINTNTSELHHYLENNRNKIVEIIKSTFRKIFINSIIDAINKYNKYYDFNKIDYNIINDGENVVMQVTDNSINLYITINRKLMSILKIKNGKKSNIGKSRRFAHYPSIPHNYLYFDFLLNYDKSFLSYQEPTETQEQYIIRIFTKLFKDVFK